MPADIYIFEFLNNKLSYVFRLPTIPGKETDYTTMDRRCVHFYDIFTGNHFRSGQHRH
jgi:hypothetical protein